MFNRLDPKIQSEKNSGSHNITLFDFKLCNYNCEGKILPETLTKIVKASEKFRNSYLDAQAQQRRRGGGRALENKPPDFPFN